MSEQTKQTQCTNETDTDIVIDDQYSFQVALNTASMTIFNESIEVMYFLVCPQSQQTGSLINAIPIMANETMSFGAAPNIKVGGSDRCIVFTRHAPQTFIFTEFPRVEE